MSEPEVTFRPVRRDNAADLEILYRLYASTRQEELAQTPWSDQEKEDFLRFQFDAQHKFYMEHFPGAEFSMVLLDGEVAGRLYLDRREDEFRLIDIALFPAHRNKGVGAKLMRDLLAEAGAAGKLVRIHVEQFNPAMHLYQRLGFEKIEEQGVYHLMEWSPLGNS